MSTYYGLDTIIGAEDELYSPWNSPGQRTGVGGQFPSPGDLPLPRIQTQVSHIAGGFFSSWAPGKPSTGVGSLSIFQWIFPTQE